MKPSRIGRLLALGIGFAALPAVAESSHGELLYTTYCVACHTEKVHWRDKKLARNWQTLVAEVRRWQEVEKLRWSEGDVEDVARYLNALHYRYTLPAN